MMKSMIQAFVLTKNEEANIARSLEALTKLDIEVCVLDSGSTDATLDLVRQFPKATSEPYAYTNHCNAYNFITTNKGSKGTYLIIIDADMIVSEGLINEVRKIIEQDSPDAIKAPVKMCVEGVPLEYGSLYPPKPFVFKQGKEYFSSEGHGEILRSGLTVKATVEMLTHDDRKSYQSFLESQCRYSEAFNARSDSNSLGLADKLRLNTPLMVWLVPFLSLFCKFGFFAGKAGKIYALDRLIAEAIRRRSVLASKLKKSK